MKIGHINKSPHKKPVFSDLVSDARVPSVKSDRVGESSMKKKRAV